MIVTHPDKKVVDEREVSLTVKNTPQPPVVPSTSVTVSLQVRTLALELEVIHIFADANITIFISHRLFKLTQLELIWGTAS